MPELLHSHIVLYHSSFPAIYLTLPVTSACSLSTCAAQLRIYLAIGLCWNKVEAQFTDHRDRCHWLPFCFSCMMRTCCSDIEISLTTPDTFDGAIDTTQDRSAVWGLSFDVETSSPWSMEMDDRVYEHSLHAKLVQGCKRSGLARLGDTNFVWTLLILIVDYLELIRSEGSCNRSTLMLYFVA